MTFSNERGPRQGKKNLYARLAELERIQEQIKLAAAARSQKANSEEFIERFRLLMKVYGFEQSPTESFFEMIARALGIGTREMRAQIRDGRFKATLLRWAAAREAEIKEACRISEMEAAQSKAAASERF